MSITEQRHETTNNVAVWHENTQISLGISHVWSESSLSIEESLGPSLLIERTATTMIRLWVDAQADLSLSLVQTHFLLVLSCHGSFNYRLEMTED